MDNFGLIKMCRLFVLVAKFIYNKSVASINANLLEGCIVFNQLRKLDNNNSSIRFSGKIHQNRSWLQGQNIELQRDD